MMLYTENEQTVLQVLERMHGSSSTLEITALGHLTIDEAIFAIGSLKNKGKVRIKTAGRDGIRDEIVILRRQSTNKIRTADIILVSIVLISTLYFVWKA